MNCCCPPNQTVCSHFTLAFLLWITLSLTECDEHFHCHIVPGDDLIIQSAARSCFGISLDTFFFMHHFLMIHQNRMRLKNRYWLKSRSMHIINFSSLDPATALSRCVQVSKWAWPLQVFRSIFFSSLLIFRCERWTHTLFFVRGRTSFFFFFFHFVRKHYNRFIRHPSSLGYAPSIGLMWAMWTECEHQKADENPYDETEKGRQNERKTSIRACKNIDKIYVPSHYRHTIQFVLFFFLSVVALRMEFTLEIDFFFALSLSLIRLQSFLVAQAAVISAIQHSFKWKRKKKPNKMRFQSDAAEKEMETWANWSKLDLGERSKMLETECVQCIACGC